MNLRNFTAVLAAGAAFVCAMPEAAADKQPVARVYVLHATNCAAPPALDPAIGAMPKALGYNCFAKLDQKDLSLTKGQAASMDLAKIDRTFQIVLNDASSNDGKSLYKITASVSQPGNKASFTKLADISTPGGKRFEVGGWSHGGGAILLAIRIEP
jgi:hypothetical protein